VLKTPPGSSGVHDVPGRAGGARTLLVCQVGSTKLTYDLRAIEDLHQWLTEQGDWVPLGATTRRRIGGPEPVEAFGRSADNPIRRLVRPAQGYPRASACTFPPLMEALGLGEVTH